MEPKHVITQVVGITAAVLLARWGFTEMRRDWKNRRLPLISGPYGGGTVWVVLAALALLVPVLSAIIFIPLVPRDSPLFFGSMIVWLSLGFSFGFMGGLSRQVRWRAQGWVTVVGEDTLQVAAGGVTATFVMRPGVARLSFIDDPSARYAQLDLDDGKQVAHVWGMVGIRDMKLVTPGQVVQPQGLMVGASMHPLCRWLVPFLPQP